MLNKDAERAPDFHLPVIGKGKQISLSDCDGKAVLVTFWVTWCPACQQDLPQKEVFYQSLQSQQFVFLTVNVTGRETEPEKVIDFLQDHRLTFPVLRDDGTRVYDAYGVTSVPTSVLISPSGHIVNRYDETIPFINILTELGPFLKS